MSRDLPIERIEARSYTIPTDTPEADGTMSWTSTTLVTVEVAAGGETGFGYTYGAGSIVPLVNGTLAETARGRDAMDIPGTWKALQGTVRNMGRSGIAATAISAIDIALWDLKAKLLGLPLASLLGRARETVPIYGSGGFTSYDDATLQEQLAGWVERDGCRAVKMKIGSEPERDPARVAAARRAVGDAGLFVDANGAFGPKTALRMAEMFTAQDVAWFEEPVSSDDVAGLAFVRAHAPARTRSRPENTATRSTISADCSKAARWMCCRPMSRAAAASPGSSRWPRSPMRTMSTCPGIAARRRIATSPAPCHACATWNGSTTMSASSRCCSTARRLRTMELSGRI